MLEKKWEKIKSGTDIRGTAVKTTPDAAIDLDDDTVIRIAIGFATWLNQTEKKKLEDMTIAVGYDSRISSENIKKISVKALRFTGVNVIDCGLASTPAMFMTIIDLKCDASIQITASHHPYDRNGFKFFTKNGGLESKDIEEILEYAQNTDINENENVGEYKKVAYMDNYSENLKKIICENINAEDYLTPLKGYKIAVDAGNGAGGFFAEKVLKPLGADVSGSQFLEPDGMFPNHIPNPEKKEAIDSICNAVVKSNSDLGIIFDTDVDRSSCVDGDGKEINRNRLIAIASAIALENNSKATIVTDSVTSTGLHEFIEKELGGKHYRFKRGYKNVIDEAMRLNKSGTNCPLAIETSGHAAFKENYFLDDGAYLAVKIIIKMVQLGKAGKKIGSLIENMREPSESDEIRIEILEDNFREYGEKIISDLKNEAQFIDGCNVEQENYEGVKLWFDKKNGNGWILLRLSVHDPVIAINLESDSTGGVQIMKNKLFNFLKRYKNLGCIN